MRKVTEYFIMAIVLVCIVYDLYAITSYGSEATISSRITVLSKDYQIIPFMFGALMSHFFWRLDKNKDIE